MCSGGDSTLKQTEQAQAQLTKDLDAAFLARLGKQDEVLAQLKGIYTTELTNPQGLPGAEIAAARTNAIDTTATQFEGASRAANAVAAAHGGDALPSGVNAQVSGELAATAATTTAKELTSINVADAEAKRANYWQAISGLGSVGEAYNPTSFSNSSAGAANSTANLGQAFLASQQAGWADFGGILSGIGGLATGAGAIGKGFGFGG